MTAAPHESLKTLTAFRYMPSGGSGQHGEDDGLGPGTAFRTQLNVSFVDPDQAKFGALATVEGCRSDAFALRRGPYQHRQQSGWPLAGSGHAVPRRPPAAAPARRADAARIAHIGRLGHVVAQLAAKTLHDRAYQLRGGGATLPLAPRLAQQRVVRHGPPRVGREYAEHLELGHRQRHEAAGDGDAAVLVVNRQVPQPEGLRLGPPPQGRPRPRRQFRRREGLRDVIGGSRIQRNPSFRLMCWKRLGVAPRG